MGCISNYLSNALQIVSLVILVAVASICLIVVAFGVKELFDSLNEG